MQDQIQDMPIEDQIMKLREDLEYLEPGSLEYAKVLQVLRQLEVDLGAED